MNKSRSITPWALLKEKLKSTVAYLIISSEVIHSIFVTHSLKTFSNFIRKKPHPMEQGPMSRLITAAASSEWERSQPSDYNTALVYWFRWYASPMKPLKIQSCKNWWCVKWREIQLTKHSVTFRFKYKLKNK